MANTNKPEDIQKEIDKSVKLFDVAKPNSSPASATSRPIIVRHNSAMKHDPMMAPTESTEESKPEPIQSHTAPKVIPSDKEEQALPDEPVKDSANISEIRETKTETEPETETELEATPESVNTEPNQDDLAQPNSVVVDTLVNEVTAKRQEQKEEEALTAKYEEVEKSVASKKFFVPIGQESRRKSNNRTLFAIILILLAGAVALNFGIDAEVLDLGVNALTDFF